MSIHLRSFLSAQTELQHAKVVVVSYMQALAVGWSIYWRQALWIVSSTLVAVAAFRLTGNTAGHLGIYTGVGLLLLLFYGVAFPRTILRVVQLRYSDFHLDPRRGEMPTEVRYWEAAALSAVVNLVPMLGAPVLRMCIGAVPVLGAVVVGLYPILVAMPLTGWLLTGVPILGLRVEVEEP